MPLAFACIYVLWGGTFLAIRIAVHDLPPFLTAGARFFIAGVTLSAFKLSQGVSWPSTREWRNLAVLGACMFVATYGPLFWAQQFVPSSVTAVIEASLPVTIAVLEVFVFRRLALTVRLAAGLMLGFGGILLMLYRNTEQHLAIAPCLVILGSGLAWSLGTVLSRELVLPDSKPLTAGCEMALGGAVLLALAALRGEWHSMHRVPSTALWALGYLIVCGSLIAYTAYVWLLGRMPASRVASHAYVNPLIALALGFFLADEMITLRTLIASMIVIGSVFLLLGGSEGQHDAGAAPARLSGGETS